MNKNSNDYIYKFNKTTNNLKRDLRDIEITEANGEIYIKYKGILIPSTEIERMYKFIINSEIK